MGYFLLHFDYGVIDMSQAVPQGAYGDTAYYLIPTYPLPLLMPLHLIPGVGPILADMWDPALRVLVEAGYDRTINPGVPTPYNPFYSPDPTSSPIISASRCRRVSTTRLKTSRDGPPVGYRERPGPYGVGGPPVTMDLITDHQQLTTMAAPTESASPPAEPVDNSEHVHGHTGPCSARCFEASVQSAHRSRWYQRSEAHVDRSKRLDVTRRQFSRVCVGRST